MACNAAPKEYSRKRPYEEETDGLSYRLSAWMQSSHAHHDAHIDVRSTVQLAMDLERDVRRCLNQRAQSYERNRIESLRVAMANPIPAAPNPPRTRELKASEQYMTRSPLSALRRAGNANPKQGQDEIIASGKDKKKPEVAMMAALNLRSE
mmetsp:Transcript_25574/g.64470  ORF Transcript_25574/g.64470 Transcript_25574/m.64470 type:complete len:151 (-) Transcript_25574:352-804(-)